MTNVDERQATSEEVVRKYDSTRRFTVLLLALLSMLFIPVFLPDRLEGVVGPVLFTVVLLSALVAVAGTRRRVAGAAALAIPACGLVIAASLLQLEWLIVASAVVAILFLAIASVTILGHVYRARQVDVGIIVAALCVYMLMAAIWAEFYALVVHLEPGAISFPPADGVRATRSILQYFSLVTITTVGYGDVLPVAPIARAAAATEALVGQLYLVVLVARLVGLHTAQEATRRS